MISWKIAGIVYCLSLAAFCAGVMAWSAYKGYRYNQRRIPRGPFKDWKRNSTEAVP